MPGYKRVSGLTLYTLEATFTMRSVNHQQAGTRMPKRSSKPSDLPDQPRRVVKGTTRRASVHRKPGAAPVTLQLLAGRPFNLPPPPQPLHPIIGREDELAALATLLADPEIRLVTITGLGGIGKTRLLLEYLQHCDPPVAWVSLSSLREQGLFLDTIAAALGVTPGSGQALLDRLIATIADRPLLLALDNLEHLLPATTDLTTLLTYCPGLRIITTSRVRLNLSGEHLLPLPPLALPATDTADLLAVPSVDLFVQRARAVAPDYPLTKTTLPLIAAIVQRLDGLPLAIELASTRATTLSPADLLSHLDQPLALLSRGSRDADFRQQTMRETIAWSAELLSATEQAALRRLAVFHGSFTLAAAEQVVSGVADSPYQIEQDPGFESIFALLEHHLLVHRANDDPPRYRMLQTIREYAFEELLTSGEVEQARDAHAAWYLAFVHAGAFPDRPEKTDAWLDTAVQDIPNLRAAFRCLVDQNRQEELLRFVFEAHQIAWSRGHVREIHQWHETALTLGATALGSLRCNVLIWSGLLAAILANDALAMSRLDEGLAMARIVGDPVLLSWAFRSRGQVAGYLGYDEEAAGFQAQATRVTGSGVMNEAAAWLELTSALIRLGHVPQAIAACDEAERRNSSLGSRRYAALNLINRGTIDFVSRNIAEARQAYAQALLQAGDLRDASIVVDAIMCSAAIPVRSGDCRTAVRLLAAADALRQETGRRRFRNHPRFLLLRSVATGSLEAAALEAEWRSGAALGIEDASELAFAALQEAEIPSEKTSLLSRRELDILRLMAKGFTDQQIAQGLFIARPTASNHVQNILLKLDVHSRAAAVSEAHLRGLLQAEG